jgi:hypothetical protein
MKNNKTQMALIVAAALLSMAQAHAAETISITTQFTPLESLSAQDRTAIQTEAERETLQQIDWENSIIGKNEHGKIEVRDKRNLKLIAHIEPTCMAQ